MKIMIVFDGVIPASMYGGTQRVIWALGKELVSLGHKVTYLVNKGSECGFADVRFINYEKSLVDQIDNEFDIVHFNFTPPYLERMTCPYVITMHGNVNDSRLFDLNTIFVSGNHAARYGSNSFVYNGLDWSEYIKPDLNKRRGYFHFLGNAAWRVKNVKGAIDVVKNVPGERINVLGGVRFNFKMGLRLTFSTKAAFFSKVDDIKKGEILNCSKGLVFPVLWHEPFGLAIIESLYYGCPVFGTPYGSLPEIVTEEYGFLSAVSSEISEQLNNAGNYSPQRCHDYAASVFNSLKMTEQYLIKYEKVLNGNVLNNAHPLLIEIQKDKFLPFK